MLRYAHCVPGANSKVSGLSTARIAWSPREVIESHPGIRAADQHLMRDDSFPVRTSATVAGGSVLCRMTHLSQELP
jgi:hypothetical protein